MGSRQISVFLDANVIIAAVMAPEPDLSAAVAVIRICVRGLVAPCLSQQVIEEVEHTVAAKRPQLVPSLRELLGELSPRVVPDPSPGSLEQALDLIHAKDAPILAAAQETQVDFLVTRDLRHFGSDAVRDAVEFQVVTPGELLRALREGVRPGGLLGE